MESFTNEKGFAIVYAMIQAIQDNKENLSNIDGAIGDGDHGINMNKGFTLCKTRLEGQALNLSEGLKLLSKCLLTDIGGSMGPLYGCLFRNMGKACADKEMIDAVVLDAMLQKGLEGVQGVGGAKVGDKTLIDALQPASEAFHAAVESGETLAEALEKMRLAAERGRDSTVNLVAKLGRASRLGERSRGVMDAGAASCYLLLDAFAKSAAQLCE